MLESSLPSALIEDVAPPSGPPITPVILDDEHQESSGVAERGEREREIAFQAAPFVWHGKPLAAFAVDREGDWLLHRALIGAPALRNALQVATAFTPDAYRILWFCSHDSKEWTERKDRLHKVDAEEHDQVMTAERWAPIIESRIRAWAVENIRPGEQSAAVDLAFQIFNRAHTNRALIKPDPKGKEAEPGNSPGPASELNM